jgi:hypothetical protein
MFIGVVGVLGAGVRVVRSGGEVPAQAQPALERQAKAADSAAAAQRNAHGARGGRGGRGGRASSSSSNPRSATRARASSDDGDRRQVAVSPAHRAPVGELDRPGYIGNRLDLDVATAAQIDSLPGVSALMARRIATDRARRGPFLNRSGLQRVSGVGSRFLQQIDTLVTFSGTFAVAAPSDTVIKSRRKRRR